MRRRQPDPVLMGEPSPSLAKINKMNMEELTERIKALEVESGHLDGKIAQLSAAQPPDAARIAALTTQKARLAALSTAARQRLAGKIERSRLRPPGGGSRFTRR